MVSTKSRLLVMSLFVGLVVVGTGCGDSADLEG